MNKEKILRSLWSQMTPDEQMELAIRGLCGSIQFLPNGDVLITRGSYFAERRLEYEDFLINKYYKPQTKSS